MLDFLKRLFNPEPSSVTARERLRLVLLSDHLALAPDVVESLKADLIAVISKYVDVDAANCDVTFEQQESVVAMLANIPILGMKPAVRTPRPSPPPEPLVHAIQLVAGRLVHRAHDRRHRVHLLGDAARTVRRRRMEKPGRLRGGRHHRDVRRLVHRLSSLAAMVGAGVRHHAAAAGFYCDQRS